MKAVYKGQLQEALARVYKTQGAFIKASPRFDGDYQLAHEAGVAISSLMVLVQAIEVEDK